MPCKIRWKFKYGNDKRVVTGLTTYADEAAAGKQISIWQWLFPDNQYEIIPA